MLKNIRLKPLTKKALIVIKWMLIATFVGFFAGSIGTGFYHSVHFVTELRNSNPWLLYLLPIGGLIIVFIFRICKLDDSQGTNRVFSAVRDNEKLPFITAPLIFISSVITHLFGGSAGKEGAALQIGGSVAGSFAKLFRLDEKDRKILIMCGMSAVFASIFGTPVTASFFALEVINVGMLQFSALVPCAVSAIIGARLAEATGVPMTHFVIGEIPDMTIVSFGKVCIVSVLCALLSILFCIVLHKAHHLYEKFIPNSYLRIVAGGMIIVLLTLIIGTQDYNGAGMEIINRAFTGEVRYEAFILKIIFTAFTLGAGYKGGEIVPVLFTGATFGNTVGRILNLSPAFGAGIGLISLFCGVTNCPVTSLVMSVEIFGGEGIIYFFISCALSYLFSGYWSLYNEQHFMFSKLKGENIDKKAL